VFANRNVGFGAEHCLFEFQRDVFPQIRTALCPAAPARTAAEKIAKAEKVAKDLADILEDCGIKPARSATTHSGMSEAVIRRSLVCVGQDRVGFAAFLEFFFRIGVIGIAIRMKLQRQLAIGAFNLLIVGFALNPEDFVVVAFYVAGQNGSKSFRYLLISALGCAQL
jgi:hypothetical protein